MLWDTLPVRPRHLRDGPIGCGFVFGVLSVKAMCGDPESAVE